MKPIPEHGKTVTLTRNEYAELIMRSGELKDALSEVISFYDGWHCQAKIVAAAIRLISAPPSVSDTQGKDNGSE